jgi:magnesium chelatase subunit I
MNPEEGRLRPQILDRFGLRLIIRGLEDQAERLEAYRRVQAYLTNPRAFIGQYTEEMAAVSGEIQAARQRLKQVVLSDAVARPAIQLIQKMGIDSLRAEITWFEAARAHAAADNRDEVTYADLKTVAPMCLRLRRSNFMSEYFNGQKGEEDELNGLLLSLGRPKPQAQNKKKK